jgi:hypothetical protein
MKESGLFEPVGPHRKKPDGNSQLFEMPASLNELILAAAWRLKGEGRCVQDHVARRAPARAAS